MPASLQATLMQLLEQVQQDPNILPAVPLDKWQEGSDEWRLLESFHAMLERFHQQQEKLARLERFSLAAQNTNDGLWVWHLTTNAALFSPQWKRLLGYQDHEIAETIGEWRLRLHPDDVDRVLEASRAAIDGKTDSYQIEYRLRHKDRSYHWVVDRATTLRDARGQVERLAGSMTDITERKLAEERLREKEEQYSTLFEAVADGLLIVELDENRVVEVNRSGCELFDHTHQEFLGRRMGLSDDTQQPPLYARDVVRSGERFQVRVKAIGREGKTFPAEIHALPYPNQGKTHMLVIVRDLTEQAQAEQRLSGREGQGHSNQDEKFFPWEALTSLISPQEKQDTAEIARGKTEQAQAEAQSREREEQYRSIFEAVTDGLLIVELDENRVVEVNPRACELYGFTREESLGRVFLLSDDTQDPPVYARDVVRAGGLFQMRGHGSGKDGRAFPAELRGSPFTYRGTPHMLVIVRDITEQVQAEQHLREREEQYRSIFEATSDGLAISDLDGFYVEANPAFCRMLDYTYEELISQHYTKFTYPEFYTLLAESRKRVRAGGQLQAQGQIRRKDGSPVQVDAHYTSFTYKGQQHVLVVLRNITEQVEAERQLREREEQYRSIFEATTDAVFIMDLEDGHIIEANPAACTIYGYSYEEFIGLLPSAFIRPDQLPLFLEEGLPVLRAGGKRHIQGEGVNLRKDGSVFPIDLHQTTFTYQGKPHILSVIRDITERVEAERQLREREALYRGIFEATYDALAIIDLEGHYVEVNPAVCQMFGYTREELIGQHVSARTAPASQHNTTRALSLLQAGRSYAHSTGASPSLGVRKDGSVFPFEAHGSLITYRGQSHALIVGRDITEQVQAQHLLEQRVEERTRELSTLLEVSHNVASTLELKPLLGLILDQLKSVVEYSGASINTLEEESLVIVEYRGFRPAEQMVGRRFLLKHAGILWETLLRSEPAIINDVLADAPLAQTYRALVGGELLNTSADQIGAWMAVPLVLKEQVMGMLTITARESDYFTAHHAALAQAVANQAAVAMANARLYEQAQALAALEERQKLARELHDSVSQALYGIALGAHSARTALQRDPEHVAEPLDYVLSLAEAGLAEMRALIFELRPESLETEGLVAALTKQGSALQARYELSVHVDLCDEPALPLAIKQELYRIAQEAMHNTVKHARARQVNLRLSQTSEAVLLEVRDDGVGFDPEGNFPGHLGLHSMRERVSHLGGTLQIESAKGAGTHLTAQVPLQPPT